MLACHVAPAGEWQPSVLFPEHDKMLTEFTEAAGNVLYAYYFNTLELTKETKREPSLPQKFIHSGYEKMKSIQCLQGHSPSLPMQELVSAATAN